MAKILVRIKDGKANIKVECVEGDACYRTTEQLERVLGQKTSDTPTEDAFIEPIESVLEQDA